MDLLFNIGNHPMKFEHCKPNGTPESTIFSIKVIVTLTFDLITPKSTEVMY
jgi:hypothetical protein